MTKFLYIVTFKNFIYSRISKIIIFIARFCSPYVFRTEVFPAVILLPDDGPVSVETCRSWCFCNNIVNLMQLCASVCLNCSNWIVMHEMENVKCCNNIGSVIDEWRSHWSIGGIGQLTCSERNLFHRHFVRHKSHVNWPEVELSPSRWETGDKSSELWHGYIDEGIILKTGLTEITSEDVDWIELTPGRDHRRSPMNKVPYLM